jgi:RNA polymerase sigma-54 factor
VHRNARLFRGFTLRLVAQARGCTAAGRTSLERMGNFLQPRLHLRVSQKQILTPGLVQMVNVLALNRLELREMINQEMVANPVLEELTDDTEIPAELDENEPAMASTAEVAAGPETPAETLTEAAGPDSAHDEEPPEADGQKEIQDFIREELIRDGADSQAASPFDEFDASAFFNQYLDSGGAEPMREREEIERPSFEMFLSSPQRLADHLNWQLRATICSEAVRTIAEIIIGNLDEDGYLTATLEEIAQSGTSGAYDMEDVEEALAVVQEFDPLGVAGRNLRECLLIQLRALDPHNTLAQQVVSECLPLRAVADDSGGAPDSPLVRHFQNSQFKEIARALNRPVEHIKHAAETIKRLDPRPGLRYNKAETRVVEPDVYFRKTEDGWQVFMNDDDLPQLRLSPTYRRLLSRDVADKDVRTYVKERFTAAIQLMKNIEQRKHTIVRVCQAIIRRQGEFLDKGADSLRPLMIKEVAEEVGVHPSTVSRAVSSKYAHTPQGVLELRSFFSESVNGPGGDSMSLQTLKRRVRKMIDEEDATRPLTDDQIAKKLEEEGINVTRRTVAKYREDMRIPSTHQRRVKA